MIWDRQKLADHLRITRKTVGRYIEKLEKFGLLIDRRKGQGSPNWIYTLKPDLEEVDTYKSTSIANTMMGQKVTSRSNLKLQQDESKVYTSDTDANSLEDKDRNSVLQAIKVLHYSNKPIKSNGVEMSLGEIRKNLKQLKNKHIVQALKNYNQGASSTPIGNPRGYLSVCIYNSIFTTDLKNKSSKSAYVSDTKPIKTKFYYNAPGA